MMNKRHDLTKDSYNKHLTTQIDNCNPFTEQTHGGRKKLFVFNKLIASYVHSANIDLGELSKQQFASFLGCFSRGLYRVLLKDPDIASMKINFLGISRNKNIQLWNEMPVGQYFYNIDLCSAYWQMAFRLGYISEKTFLKYLPDDRYKSAKRLCISFLARPNKMTYHNANGSTYTIHCDMSVLKQVYDNIRNELYTLLNSISTKTEYLEYNIDGITIMPADIQKVQDYFSSLDLKYKITLCRKIDTRIYTAGSAEKIFIRKLTTNPIIN